MKDKVKKDNLNDIRNQLENNFYENFDKYEQMKWFKSLDIVALCHGAIILALALSNKRKMIDFVIGLIFIALYLTFNILLLNSCIRKHLIFKLIITIQLLVIGVLSYNAFSLLLLFLKVEGENTLKFILQIAFHSHITLLFSSQTIHFKQSRTFQFYYSLVWVINAAYFSISTYIKYTDETELIVSNVILEIAMILLTSFVILYLYLNQRSQLNFIKQLSYQCDLEKFKFKKLEFFLASLENQQIILVQHRLVDAPIPQNYQRKFLDNEFIESNQNAKDHFNRMHKIYQKIRNHETDENRKKFMDILENKSSREEWRNPSMYSFKLKQEFHESLLANFVGFQDLQVKIVNGEIDLDKSSHYYAIQLVQNDRLLLKISRKFIFLQDFIKIFKGYVKGDDFRVRVVSVYEDYCQIIQNELDLYRVLTFPKEKLAEIRSNDTQVIKQMEYNVKQIERNINIFFEMYKDSKNIKASHLILNEGRNIKLTKEIYLMINHILMNTIISFIDYTQNIKISFEENSQNIVLTIKLQKLDGINIKEERMHKNILNIEDSFENLINKVQNVVENRYHYHKESQNLNLIYTVNIPKQNKQLLNFNHSFNDPNNFSNYESSNQFKISKNNPSSYQQEALLQKQEKGLDQRSKTKEQTNPTYGYANTFSKNYTPYNY